MRYTKPEITVLGEASDVIQGSGKTVISESVQGQTPGPNLFELED